jgi:hypothetical protein
VHRWAAPLAAIVLTGGAARAQEVTPRVLFVSSIGYNDNVTNAPSYPKAGVRGPEADAFLSLSPSASLTYGTPRTSSRLAYTFDARFNFNRTNANTYGNKLVYSGNVDVAPTVDLDLMLTGKVGRVGSLVSSDPAAESTLESLPTGLFLYLDLTAEAKLTEELSARTRVYEKTSFAERVPFEDSSEFTDPQLARVLLGSAKPRLTWNNSAGITHDFPFDIVGGDLDIGYLETASQQRFINTLSANWAHNFDHLGIVGVTTRADLGLVQIMSADDPSAQFLQPAGQAVVGYDLDDTQASLTYLHKPQANLINGTLNYVDSLTMRAVRPLWHDSEWKAAGSAGWQRNLQIANDGETGEPQNLFLLDAQISYSPVTRVLNTLTFSVRYQRRMRLPMPPAREGFFAFEGTESNTYLFTIAASYPDRDRARAPFLVPSYRPEPSGSGDVVGSETPPPSE